ncbi:MAG: prepilin-type N-terminal cleavage/methylation domain-containing protein [Elusimicrobia bacterium]|nr:prepilin-type N-terminal cleavage/methylation domain-containing protein [Elusimicrobiota bacterium]MBP9699309.1 prepilin-type N-terminal cleavage/methylation domain-containing protein [Elusimicrobiota bacterium]
MTPRARGITLVEVIIASAVFAILMAGIGMVIKNFALGARILARDTPLQHDLDFAIHVIEKDLLSSSRNSVMNLLPDPGFETLLVATGTAPLSGRWVADPYRMDPFTPSNNTIGHITADFRLVRNRSRALVLTSFGAEYAVSGPPLFLPAGEYALGGWVARQMGGSHNRRGGLRLLEVNTLIEELDTNNTSWEWLAQAFSSTGNNYRVTLFVSDQGPDIVTSFIFDDVYLGPLSQTLTPGDGETVEFLRVNPANGSLQRIRYQLLPWNNSGRMVRSIVPAVGPPVSAGADIKNVRLFSVGWLGGAASMTTEGTNQPLSVRIECGPVAAADLKTVRTMDLTIFPLTP